MARTRPLALGATLLLAVAGAAEAQSAHGQPYAGQQAREVKALSDGEIADLLAGRGMGLAKAGELNGFPGPMHVMEHAERLGLDPAQRAAVEAQFARMSADAKALGGRIVEAERALDRAFASRAIEPAALGRHTAEIAALQGELRAVHLRAHLETTATLRPEQVALYSELRGYGAAPGGHGAHSGGHAAPRH